MDELLYERVKQLKDIDERLERLERMGLAGPERTYLRTLRADLYLMILEAERQHAEF